MSNILPKASEIGLIMADDVRLEHNSKLTILGAFIGNSIKVRDIGANFAIPLAYIFYILEGEGKYNAEIEIKSPSGKVLLKAPQQIEKIKDRSVTHIIKMLNFPVAETGIYKVNLSLDGTMFPLQFSLAQDATIS